MYKPNKYYIVPSERKDAKIGPFYTFDQADEFKQKNVPNGEVKAM